MRGSKVHIPLLSARPQPCPAPSPRIFVHLSRPTLSLYPHHSYIPFLSSPCPQMKSLVGAASGARFATEMTVRDGLNSAMDEEMERDPAVV